VLHKICKSDGYYDAVVKEHACFLNGCCAHSSKGFFLKGKIFLKGNMILYVTYAIYLFAVFSIRAVI
jgi:hypothetical protein